ncbi:FecR family protein [Pseudomonas japonica]|uniref:FecR family protein n=1 Tax=Pseudomonas japonica TaxID=256466 RepID=A0A239FAD4_9PSED|nr:FecR domain-containing protein [Pseudomonas japonica]SNS53112.1 FecR family protein [Pseudomonas japonica]
MIEARMSEPLPFTDLSDAAIDWQVLLHSGNASAADRARYQRWRGLSAEHLAAAEEAEALWGDIGQTQAAAQLPPAPRRRQWGSAIAAALLLAVVGYVGWQQAPGLLADYHTSIGERRTVTLEDGSRVTLNSASAFSVNYTRERRSVSLREGEALFEPAADPRPFVVDSAGEAVQGSGAVFSVRREGGTTAVVVAQGEARIGERLVQASPDALAQTAWQRGKLIFNGRPLREVIAELERYQHGRILISDSQLGAMEVSGVFDLNDPHGLLRTLEQRYALKVTYLPWLAVLY